MKISARPPLGFTDFTATDQDPVCGFFRSSPAVFDIEDNLLRSSVIRGEELCYLYRVCIHECFMIVIYVNLVVNFFE